MHNQKRPCYQRGGYAGSYNNWLYIIAYRILSYSAIQFLFSGSRNRCSTVFL